MSNDLNLDLGPAQLSSKFDLIAVGHTHKSEINTSANCQNQK